MQARNIYNDPKTLIQFYLKDGPTRRHTHTNENKPRVVYWTLAAEERDELGVIRVQLGPDLQRKGVLRGAAPANGHWFGPQSHVWDSWFMVELGW